MPKLCPLSSLGFCLVNFLLILLPSRPDRTVGAIIFDEVSSLARKDPNNNKALLFRQIELNWINAPNEDSNDYIGLYLDHEPDGGSLPVSVHKINGRQSGQFTTDYYLPQIDFYNETSRLFDASGSSTRQTNEVPSALQDYELSSHNQDNLFQDTTSRHSSAIDRWSSNPAIGHRLFVKRTTAGPANGLTSECLGYCVAYHSRDRILAKNCLKLQPTWMQEQFHSIGTRALPTLMLPGTHNSGTYPRQLDKSVLQMINKYQMNQDESIFNQLVFGIRHLDLRVGFSKVKNRQERLWVYHDIFRTDVSLDEVFEQVRRFLELTSHEIVIMDFHRFTVGFLNESPALQRERHAKLIELMFDQLGKYIVPSYLGQHAPLQEYVSMGKRLVVGYADRSQLVGSQSIEHSIFALYTDRARKPVRDIDAIKQDQDEQMNGLNLTASGASESNSPNSNTQVDRRMGTRIYNRLKSLKLISHSFSKRSVENNDIQLVPIKSPRRVAAQTALSNNHLDSSGDERSMQLLAQPDEPKAALASAADQSVSRVALLFSPVRHLWPNKDTLEGLAQYMNETTCRKYFGELRSMMVELTPTVFGAISDKYDGNRRLAQSVNRQVTDWIRDRWLHCINVVASDYFLGNDLIQLSIYANKMRALGRNIDSTSKIINNQQQRQCKSFRRVEHLLDKSRIPPQFAFHDFEQSADQSRASSLTPTENELFSSQGQPGYQFNQRSSFGRGSMGVPNRNSEYFVTHTNSDGKKILLEPLNQGPVGSSTGSRERRHSFVDNFSEGFSDLFSSFKRLLSL